MKKIVVMLAAVLIFAATAPAQVMDLTGMIDGSAFGIVDIPTGFTQGDWEEGGMARELGFGGGVSGDYFFHPYVGAGVHFMYHTFSGKDFGDQPMDDKFTAIMIGAHVKGAYPLEMGIIPYGTAGGGLALTEWKDIGEDLETWDIDPAFYITGNVGVMYFVSPTVSVFAEAGGNYILLDGTTATADSEEFEFPKSVPFATIKAGVNVWFSLTPQEYEE
ncbi:MAG: outer membrane beta-barrel protein [Aliifodinibius sp.]|nr:porin family protein [candidate division Zixibacteria bacterium]NIV10362.1 outer membrane beta-barrel protein [Fodinibius sp.]